MAYVVRRPGGRWEIRESHSTDRGPRARTLASFTRLTAAVIARAEGRAHAPFDRDSVTRSAKRAGAVIEPPESDVLAIRLLRRLAFEDRPRPGLGRMLAARLTKKADPADDVADWIGASPEERGRALVDLLGLADRLPMRRPAGGLEHPGMSQKRVRCR